MLKENKFTLKAKKNSLDEYEAYYPKTAWDNVVTENNEMLNNYIQNNILSKEEANDTYLKLSDKENYYTKEEYDIKENKINDKLTELEKIKSEDYITNDVSSTELTKAPSMNIFKEQIDSANNKIDDIKSTINSINLDMSKVPIFFDGEQGSYKISVINTIIDIGSDVESRTIFEVSKYLDKSKVNFENVFFAVPILNSSDFSVKLKSFDMSAVKIYLELIKISNRAIYRSDLALTLIVIGN
ncbi:hypothetical protein [Anaerofustis stercorihominis]|uniref:hypothetical protein n=1 Tax=Anaerofustis stercorihominis TaxID=214853 RepID=UPI00214B91B1|nr:hypothetical protein [Anaerofustis stercorihominis]MCR2033522.1 hypothetical protein [Anaerofustis stercorihominis]